MSVTRHPFMPSARRLRGVPADPALVVRLERSYRRAAAHGDRLLDQLFDHLLKRAPGLRRIFSGDSAGHKRHLGGVLAEVISNLQSPETAQAHLTELGRHYARLGLTPAELPLIGDSLLAALADVAGVEWTAELQAEWTSAVGLLNARLVEAVTQAVP